MEQIVEQPILILASKSPRRKYLLDQSGLSVAVIPSRIDESLIKGDMPENLVKTLAKEKARDVARAYTQSWVIGADTIVLMNGRILGKPGSKDEARQMLKQLSGQRHRVFTGYAICCWARKKYISDAVKTEVQFKDLSETELEWYIQTNEPFDKAGAYAIQGLGSFLVKSISGSYTNVVGLPVCEVIEHLIREGVIEPAPGNKWNLT